MTGPRKHLVEPLHDVAVATALDRLQAATELLLKGVAVEGVADRLVELAHLKEPNHTPEFWSRIERV